MAEGQTSPHLPNCILSLSHLLSGKMLRAPGPSFSWTKEPKIPPWRDATQTTQFLQECQGGDVNRPPIIPEPSQICTMMWPLVWWQSYKRWRSWDCFSGKQTADRSENAIYEFHEQQACWKKWNTKDNIHMIPFTWNLEDAACVTEGPSDAGWARTGMMAKVRDSTSWVMGVF